MTGEKIGHQLHVLIGCVINVGEAKAGFKGLEQREVVYLTLLWIPVGA